MGGARIVGGVSEPDTLGSSGHSKELMWMGSDSVVKAGGWSWLDRFRIVALVVIGA